MGFLEAEFLGCSNRPGRTNPGLAHQNQRQAFVFNSASEFRLQLPKRNIFRAYDMAQSKFCGFADVNDDGFFTVHQLHGLCRAQALAGSALDDGGQKQRS